jgi:uncharacterized protein YoaH (UPF0181 family)
MTDQQTAIETAKGLMDNGMSLDDANIEIVRMMGVRIVAGKLDRRTRSALMQGVKDGKLGHLPKDGLKPEAFFHPNSLWNAKEERSKIANSGIRAIQACCA